MAGQLTIDTLKASTGVLATQNGMTGIAKAWVNLNAITGGINKAFNVSSITVTSATTGTFGINFTVNFTTAMPDANYAYATSTRDWNNSGSTTYYAALPPQGQVGDTKSTSALQLKIYNYGYNTNFAIAGDVSVIIFD